MLAGLRYRVACKQPRQGSASRSGTSCPASKGFSKAKHGKAAARKNEKQAAQAALEQQKKMLDALSRTQDPVESPVSAAEASTSEAEVTEVAADEVQVVKKGSGTPRSKQRVEGSLYDHPMFYDWAFGFRDYEEEVDFLFDVYEQVTGSEPDSFVELGCGPAQHSLEMTESDLEVFCVDINENMLEYAAELAKADNLAMTCLHQDMRSFALPDGKQVDLIACLLGTFQHMYTNEDAISTLAAVHRALKPGGLFLLELNHPALLFDGTIATSADTWTVELEPAQVEVWWGHQGDSYDALTQVLDKTVEVNVMMRGGQLLALEETVPLRQFTYQEVKLLAHIAGFELVETYGDFNLDSRLGADESRQRSGKRENPYKPASAPSSDDDDDADDDEAFRMILVLQKATRGMD